MHLVLFGDSVAFHNHEGRLPLTDPRLYQNVAAREVEVRTHEEVQVTTLARAGQYTPNVWRLVTKDPWVQQVVLPSADVVVLNFVAGDAIPVGIPTPVKDLIPSIPHVGLRRRVRRLYWDYHRPLVKLTLGRMRTVPRSMSLDLWPRIVDVVRFLSGAPVVTLTAQPTCAAHHGNLDPHSKSHNADVIRMAQVKGVPYFDHYAVAEAGLPMFNPNDGMHWHDDTHKIIGRAVAELVLSSQQETRFLGLSTVAQESASDSLNADGALAAGP